MRINQSEIEIIANKAFELGVRYAVRFHRVDPRGVEEKEALADAVATVRNELEKAGVPVQLKRKAIVEISKIAGLLHRGHVTVSATLLQVQHYLPSNFTARTYARAPGSSPCILIEGYDRAGCTLDGYVIPQLASGLIVAKEVKENDELPCRHLDYALTLDGGKCNDCGIELQ